MKLKFNAIFYIFILGLVLVSCKKDDDDDTIPHDPEAQALLDDDLLVDYLQTHYYIPPAAGESFGVIDTILNGEESLFLQVETENLTYDEIDYKLYYLVLEQGENISATRYDSVFVNYRGFTLDSLKFDENKNIWLNIGGSVSSQGVSSGVIQGWKYGFPHFKSGTNVSVPGEPISFENTGKGVLFIPSGLAYSNFGSNAIGPNESLIFFIDLNMVVKTDYDNDGILNEYEDLNNDGEIIDDDTDGDLSPDFIDTDDDGDGILTRDENADPNGDGNPVDALDSDGDNIPDYLDSDS
ncbi:FKBP-type peptidyl-prolyl cis-trans isomerase [Aureibaculum luteum]|uniref:FKBP-type peptidyl-prolyl cis-trans isomerase n=1 Tax=Aureibaculum luteum TaxID=1548456 RepID=UPI000E4C9C42|nr:FKBP-type peptidyl-prolyl cis-trans isomerase [Aureibaculum luteum]